MRGGSYILMGDEKLFSKAILATNSTNWHEKFEKIRVIRG
jgi:hypothetical protein